MAAARTVLVKVLRRLVMSVSTSLVAQIVCAELFSDEATLARPLNPPEVTVHFAFMKIGGRFQQAQWPVRPAFIAPLKTAKPMTI